MGSVGCDVWHLLASEPSGPRERLLAVIPCAYRGGICRRVGPAPGQPRYTPGTRLLDIEETGGGSSSAALRTLSGAIARRGDDDGRQRVPGARGTLDGTPQSPFRCSNVTRHQVPGQQATVQHSPEMLVAGVYET